MITVTEEFGCPDVTFRSWQDIKIQLLTIVFIDTLFADLKKEKKKKKKKKKKEKRISWYVKNKFMLMPVKIMYNKEMIISSDLKYTWV